METKDQLAALLGEFKETNKTLVDFKAKSEEEIKAESFQLACPQVNLPHPDETSGTVTFLCYLYDCAPS